MCMSHITREHQLARELHPLPILVLVPVAIFSNTQLRALACRKVIHLLLHATPIDCIFKRASRSVKTMEENSKGRENLKQYIHVRRKMVLHRFLVLSYFLAVVSTSLSQDPFTSNFDDPVEENRKKLRRGINELAEPQRVSVF